VRASLSEEAGAGAEAKERETDSATVLAEGSPCRFALAVLVAGSSSFFLSGEYLIRRYPERVRGDLSVHLRLACAGQLLVDSRIVIRG